MTGVLPGGLGGAGSYPGVLPVRVGREMAGVLEQAEQLEWLVTNGLGGYGSGTVAGSITRGYHGLLIAAFAPPLGRRLMLVKLDETLSYRDATYELATNRWASGAVAPQGHVNIESFELEGSVPCWRYACGDAIVEKRVWMQQGQNTTYAAYTVVAAAQPVQLSIRAIVDNRGFHDTGSVAWPATVSRIPGGLRVEPAGGGPALVLLADAGDATASPELYEGFLLPAEAARGLNDRDAHVHAGTFTATVAEGATLTVLASAESDPVIDGTTLQRQRAHDQSLLDAWRDARPAGAPPAPPWVQRLVLAADQFVVERPVSGQPARQSVIAGYHWFEDWGRDTMISLPGLTLVTGRAAIAASILRAFAGAVSDGMLPNRFPDTGEATYNTIDGTLWYFQAVRAYVAATGDDTLLRELWPTLQDIVAWHVKGTRYGIKVDPADGLLAGGEPGVQLTWMDAIVEGRVITPRIGKPVEVNALWHNALTAMASFAGRLGKPVDDYQHLATAAAAGFARFWNAATGYCFDVLDGPGGDDPTLRPNQLLAIALPEPLLDAAQQRAVLDACTAQLLTSRGLRSLSPDDRAFVGSYGGDQAARDGAYHQGTVWAWLLGALVDAELLLRGPTAAARCLEPLRDHLAAAGLGQVSEIFDGGPPFLPKGCIAQAWSVAESLRAFARIEQSSGIPNDPQGPA